MGRIGIVGLLAALAAAGTPEGKAALEKKDYAAARKEFAPAAESGDAEAQFLLGEIYRRGLGVGENPRIAAKWYAAAAKQGRADAAGELGILYWKARKKKDAIAQLKVGAKAKHVRAMYALAILDYRGHDVGIEDDRRLELFRLAAEGGHPDAQAKYAHHLQFRKKDFKEAERWYRKAAAQGHPEAHAGVAACRMEEYDQGDGSYNMTARDQAFEWYEKAAILGDYQAQHTLMLFYGASGRKVKSYTWAIVASSTKHSWPATSAAVTKLYKKYAKSTKEFVKKAKPGLSSDQVKEATRLAKDHIKQIKANLKKDLPWEDPDG